MYSGRRGGGADDCGFLRLHQRYIGIDLIMEQVLAEQALGESPFRRKQVRGLEVGVHPHYRREMVILDAVAGLRVVGDDFPAASAVLGVELVEDGVPVLGRTNAILAGLDRSRHLPPNPPCRDAGRVFRVCQNFVVSLCRQIEI